MSAWPFVVLILGTLVVWRLDEFARRWASWGFDKRIEKLESHMASRASLDEVAALRDKLTQMANRLGPQR